MGRGADLAGECQVDDRASEVGRRGGRGDQSGDGAQASGVAADAGGSASESGAGAGGDARTSSDRGAALGGVPRAGAARRGECVRVWGDEFPCGAGGVSGRAGCVGCQAFGHGCGVGSGCQASEHGCRVGIGCQASGHGCRVGIGCQAFGHGCRVGIGCQAFEHGCRVGIGCQASERRHSRVERGVNRRAGARYRRGDAAPRSWRCARGCSVAFAACWRRRWCRAQR